MHVQYDFSYHLTLSTLEKILLNDELKGEPALSPHRSFSNLQVKSMVLILDDISETVSARMKEKRPFKDNIRFVNSRDRIKCHKQKNRVAYMRTYF